MSGDRVNPNYTQPDGRSICKRTVRGVILGFGWFTVAAVGATLVVGSLAVTVVRAWVRLGQQASDLSGPDTPNAPGEFFAAAFREAYGGLTLPVVLAVCGIVLVLTGVVGGLLGLRRWLGVLGVQKR